MNPIIDYYPENTASRLEEWLQNHGSHFALIDHSFQPHAKLTRKLRELLPWCSLYAHQGGDDDISPLLCRLDSQDSLLRQEQIKALLTLCNGLPMLSFWRTPLDFEAIREHFVSYTEVTLLPEKLAYLLRYADTRILPHLFSVMDGVQRSMLLGPFEELLYFDRAGQVITISNTPSREINQTRLSLDASQFAALLDFSLPDQILPQLELPDGHALHLGTPSQRHERLLQLCNEAAQQGTEDPNVILSYCLTKLLGAI